MATIATVTAAWAAVRTLSIQTSPDLMLFVEPDQNSSSALRLVMRNNGEAAAYNVSFRLNKTLFPSDESFFLRLLIMSFRKAMQSCRLIGSAIFSWVTCEILFRYGVMRSMK